MKILLNILVACGFALALFVTTKTLEIPLPLRVSGVMVQADRIWKFQQLQFQFDLNTSWVLYVIILLSILFLVSIIRLLYVIIRSLYKRGRQGQ